MHYSWIFQNMSHLIYVQKYDLPLICKSKNDTDPPPSPPPHKATPPDTTSLIAVTLSFPGDHAAGGFIACEKALVGLSELI